MATETSWNENAVRRNVVLALVCLFVLAGVVSASEAERYEYSRKFFEPTEEVTTPHIAWSKPYARGPVRALFITHRNAMREVVEIAQRLSMDYTVFAAESSNKLGLTADDKWWALAMEGTTAEELADRLRADLKAEYDVIVVSRVNWDVIPVDCQYEILKKVKAGTGLAGFVPAGTEPYLERVLRRKNTGEEPCEPVLSGVPFPALPAFASVADANAMCTKHFRHAHFGHGRVLLLRNIRVPNFQGLVPQASGDAFQVKLFEYDYYLSLVIKAILWAAQQEPPVRVATSSPVLTVDRVAADARHVHFQLSAGEAADNLKLRFVVRDSDNAVLHTEERMTSVAAVEQAVEFALPPAPAGSYFADLWVLRDEQVMGWGSVAVHLTSQSRITALTLAKGSFTGDEAISGTVSLDGSRQGMILRMEHFDNHGRLLATEDLPLRDAQAQAQFSLKGIPTLSILQTVSASLVAEQVIDTTKKFVPVADFFPDREDVRFIMWQSLPSSNYVSQYVARELYRSGIDTQYTGFSTLAFRENLWHIPYAIRFTDSKTNGYNPERRRAKDDFIREPCLTDPTYRAEVKATLTRRAAQAAPYSTNDFSLGDECHFVVGPYELCFSPTCIDSFRQYAKKAYAGDLARLNKEYGTSYRSWDEVMPGKLDDARTSGHPAAWVDHRLHMESVWAGIHAFGRQAIRDVVPTARVGYEGSDTVIDSYRAADHHKLMKAMDLNNIYFRRYIVDAVRDFGGPGMLFGGGWTGGYPSNMNEPYMRWFPWMTLFRGANSFWIWMGFGGAGGVMAYDLSLYPYFEAHCEEVREIKSGIGKLMILSKYQDNGIALLHSPPSVHVNTITTGMPNIQDAYAATCCLLEDIGLQYRVVAGEEVTGGILRGGQFKVLCLSMAQAVSDAEAAAIRAFVEDGGTVIADLRPAVANEHGTPRAAGALDVLFSVRQDTAAAAFRTSTIHVDGQKEVAFSGDLPEYTLDDSLEVTSAGACARGDKTPAVILHAAGKGRAVLLNFSFNRYYDRRKGWWFGTSTAKDREVDYPGWREGGPLRALMCDLLRLAGVTPPVRIDPEVPMCQIGRFTQGERELIGVLPGLPRISWAYTFKEAEVPPPSRARIHFDRSAHIYDVRAGQYLGNAASCDIMLQPGRAKLVALSPYRVTALKLDAPNRVRPDDQVPLNALVEADGTPGLHVLRLTFIDPKGTAARHYARNAPAPRGVFHGTWTPALNEEPGVWRIVARDVVSGETALATVEVTKH